MCSDIVLFFLMMYNAIWWGRFVSDTMVNMTIDIMYFFRKVVEGDIPYTDIKIKIGANGSDTNNAIILCQFTFEKHRCIYVRESRFFGSVVWTQNLYSDEHGCLCDESERAAVKIRDLWKDILRRGIPEYHWCAISAMGPREFLEYARDVARLKNAEFCQENPLEDVD